MVKRQKFKPSYPKSDNGSKLVSPENIVVGQQYALTVNPDDAHQFFDQPKDRIYLVLDYIYTFFSNINCVSTKLYPEVSSKGRIHVHGYIRIHRVIEFYTVFVPTLLAHNHIELDTVSDENGVYEKYIKKLQPQMQFCTSANTKINEDGSFNTGSRLMKPELTNVICVPKQKFERVT